MLKKFISGYTKDDVIDMGTAAMIGGLVSYGMVVLVVWLYA